MARIEIFSSAYGECSLEANWWLFALRGALAMLFGLLALGLPEAALLALTQAFGAYATLDGLLQVAAGLSLARRGRRWAGLVTAGVLGVLVGLVALIAPQSVTAGLAAALWSLVAVWAMVSGVLEIHAALRLRRENRDGALLAWTGALAVLLGLAMVVVFWRNPQVTLTILALCLALKALVEDLLLLLLAMQLRHQGRRTRYKAIGE